MKIQCTLSRTFRGMAAAPRSITARSKSLGQTQPNTFHSQATWFGSGPINPISFTSTSRAAFTSAGTQLSSVTEHSDVGSSGPKLPDATSAFKRSTGHIEDKRFGAKLPSATAKPMAESSNKYSDGESSGAKVPSAFAKSMLEGSSGCNDDGSLKTYAKTPRPKELPFLKGITNEVHFVGLIGEPVQFKYTDSSQSLAWTTLGVGNRDSNERTWLELFFWNELAETAAQHVKKDDMLYVSGQLVSQTSAIEDNKPLKLYKIIANRLNFVASSYLSVSKQVDVNKNAPFPVVYQHAVVNRHTPFQREESPVKSSSSAKGTGEDVVILQSLWEEFFASPDDWWDNRKNKKYCDGADFKHKYTGKTLWINSPSNPAWIKTVLAKWDMRRKDSGEC